MAAVLEYIKDSYNELLHKVTWPSWSELQGQSVLVLVTSLVISGIIFLIDFTVGVNNQDLWWEGVLGNLYRHVLN
jgi:preprotein translocase subunit SecE